MLMNATINAYRDKNVKEWPSPTLEMPDIYSNTVPGAGLRKLFVYLVSHCGDEKKLTTSAYYASWPAEATSDILKLVWNNAAAAQYKSLSKRQVKEIDLCQFHCHEDGVRCTPLGDSSL